MTRPAAIAALLAVLAAWPGLAAAQTTAPRQKAPEGAQVYFHYPLDGLRVPAGQLHRPMRFGLLRHGRGNAAAGSPIAGSGTIASADRHRSAGAYNAPNCRERVLRGGSFNNDPRYLRSAARFKYEPDVRFYTNGFRVARDP
ncbi:hypothetical protein BTHI11S_00221 [Bosea thiooxidans]